MIRRIASGVAGCSIIFAALAASHSADASMTFQVSPFATDMRGLGALALSLGVDSKEGDDVIVNYLSYGGLGPYSTDAIGSGHSFSQVGIGWRFF